MCVCLRARARARTRYMYTFESESDPTIKFVNQIRSKSDESDRISQFKQIDWIICSSLMCYI